MKALLHCFNWSCHTSGFHPQTQKLCTAYKQHHRKVLLSSFRLNSHTLRFDPHTQKLEPTCTAQTAPLEGTAQWV